MYLINILDQAKNLFQVYYAGERVESAYFFRYILKSIGNTPIKDQNVEFEFDNNSSIIDVKISTNPSKSFGVIDKNIKDNELHLKTHLLNPNDEIIIEILTIGTKSSEVDIGLKNEGVSALIIDEEGARKELEDLSMKLSAITFFPFPFIWSILKNSPQINRAIRGYERK